MSEWIMPEWMDQYRPMFKNTGGNSVESLMNDKGTTVFNNIIRCMLISATEAQVSLLTDLHKNGLLSPQPPKEEV